MLMPFGTGIDGALDPRLDTKNRPSASSPPRTPCSSSYSKRITTRSRSWKTFCSFTASLVLRTLSVQYRARTLDLDHHPDRSSTLIDNLPRLGTWPIRSASIVGLLSRRTIISRCRSHAERILTIFLSVTSNSDCRQPVRSAYHPRRSSTASP